MESEKGKLSIFLKTVFFVYLMICLFFLFKANPYLYSTESLKGFFHKEKESLTLTVPEINDQKNEEQELSVAHQWRQDLQRTGQINKDITFGRKYEKIWTRDLWVNGDEAFKNGRFAYDEGEFYLVANTSKLVKTDSDGLLLWQLNLAEKNSQFLNLPIITKTRIYATTQNGRIFCLDKENGHIIWTSRMEGKISGVPVLIKNKLLFFGLREEGSKTANFLFHADPWTGSISQLGNEDVGSVNSFPPTINEETETLYVGNEEGQVFAISYKSGKLIFKSSTSTKILSGILFAEGKLAFTTLSGKLITIDAKSGGIIWETELESPTHNTPSYIPTFNYLALMTNNGYLQTVDFKTGEKIWKFLAHSEGTHKDTLILRLDGKAIEQTEMRWKNLGYAIYAPCTARKICIYNPDQGRIVGRIYLDGEMTSSPVFDGKEFMVTVKDEETGNLKLMRLKESGTSRALLPARNATKSIPGES